MKYLILFILITFFSCDIYSVYETPEYNIKIDGDIKNILESNRSNDYKFSITWDYVFNEIEYSLIDEYKQLLNEIANYVQSDNCIITNESQKLVLERIAALEKNDFKKIEKVKIPENILS